VSLKTRKKNGSGRRLHIIGQKTKLVGWYLIIQHSEK
jgi:hypothetical protein